MSAALELKEIAVALAVATDDEAVLALARRVAVVAVEIFEQEHMPSPVQEAPRAPHEAFFMDGGCRR